MSASPAGCIVEIEALRKQFGSVVAVRDLSLRIPRGGVFGLLGPNGSGKTTTIGLMLGLIQAHRGFDTAVRAGRARMRTSSALQRIGAMVESPAFYPDLSGRANLRFFQGIGQQRAAARAWNELLELVGLAERANSKFRTYSLGMKQRLGIAYALLGDPELVFLDEPTNGLDPSGMAEVRELITRLAEAGHTIVLSSHLLNEVEQVCQDVAILSRGQIIAQGKVQDLLHVQGTVRLKTTADERASQILGALDWVSAVRLEAGYIVASASPDRAGDLTRALAQQDVFVTEMVPQRVSLEKFFLQVTAQQSGAGATQPVSSILEHLPLGVVQAAAPAHAVDPAGDPVRVLAAGDLGWLCVLRIQRQASGGRVMLPSTPTNPGRPAHGQLQRAGNGCRLRASLPTRRQQTSRRSLPCNARCRERAWRPAIACSLPAGSITADAGRRGGAGHDPARHPQRRGGRHRVWARHAAAHPGARHRPPAVSRRQVPDAGRRHHCRTVLIVCAAAAGSGALAAQHRSAAAGRGPYRHRRSAALGSRS